MNAEGKSILIIYTPKDCYECPCYYEDRDMCEVLDTKAKADSGRPSWCPLRTLPKKKNTDFHPNVVYANGWNDCLKEIDK